MKLVEACELVFVAEGVLNLVSGFLLTFFPAFVMTQQGLPASDELANGNLAQFGTLVLLLGYMGVRARATPKVIEALLFGDLLWCAIFYQFVITHHGPLPTWTFGSHFSLWITAFLAVSRTTYLIASYSSTSSSSSSKTSHSTKKKPIAKKN
ncbi:uncharacterized protein ACA1_319080 [Acanthamoeba castellanii str. Neff]|uniref:Uncharacterized protein n=1 Tax=Acanthamoeba castellanii (strain ATCC 30010 / Neff) TaxID=1257118 RepID=L8GK84_ACACF|nr:uncharacterized protein ACA1_319080 [Acanthamoeba castellanii str. Neff]ELR12581.1 hypothetical protein ACA1_319080 [Acanthamoeba castellanii str. Neff]